MSATAADTVDVDGILEFAGANPQAVPGTQAWALAQVQAAVAELHRCANGLQNALDLRHPPVVVNRWRSSLNAALARVHCEGAGA